jgi:hypothetical protein
MLHDAQVYKELMIMGLLSFGIFLALNTIPKEKIDNAWLLSFEFAHVVIFFIAILIVLQAAAMVYFAVCQKQFYDQVNATATLSYVQQIRSIKRAELFHMPYLTVGYGRLREAAEFKLLQHFFCKEFNLPREFDFAAFMQLALDTNITESIEVRTFVATSTCTKGTSCVVLGALVLLLQVRAHTCKATHCITYCVAWSTVLTVIACL